MPQRRIEVLTLAGCPSEEVARALVARVVSELAVEAEVACRRVDDPAAAERLRFLGSPTIRIDGRDVEAAARERTDYTLGCRVYRTERGIANVPDEGCVRAALARSPDEAG